MIGIPSIFSNTTLRNRRVLLLRVGVFLVAGILALVGDSKHQWSSLLAFRTNTLLNPVWLLLALTMVLLPRYVVQHPSAGNQYPQLQFVQWTLKQHLLNSITWMAYLFSYEYLLRGVFLTFLLLQFERDVAILINVLVYVLLHLRKSRSEFWISIPYGFVLALLSIQLHSFYPGYILHLLFALSFEWNCIRYLSRLKSETA